MFSFLLGLAAGAVCVLNGDRTRRLVVTVLAKGQEAAGATAKEAVRWSATLVEEVQDIVAEGKAEAAREAEARANSELATPPPAPSPSEPSVTAQVH